MNLTTVKTPTQLSFSTLWTRLNFPRFVCAPMVDQSDLAFRLLVRKNGADLAYTEMIHAKNYATVKKYRNTVSDWLVCSPEGVCRDTFDRPLIVQLCGHDPKQLVEAGKYIQDSCDEGRVAAIDLNLGCPQGIAKKGNYGAYLLSQPRTVLKCLEAMCSHLRLPITAKIRLLHPPGESASHAVDVEATAQLCKDMAAVGVQMVTVHARNVYGKKQYTGKPHWDALAEIVRELEGVVPVVANGGVFTQRDALRCLASTGAAAVMSSEAILENPRLFAGYEINSGSSSECGSSDGGERAEASHGEYLKAQLDIVDEYLALVDEYNIRGAGVTTQQTVPIRTVSTVKAHLFKLLFKMLSASGNWDMRCALGTAREYGVLVGVVRELRLRAERVDYQDHVAIADGYLLDRSWYHRQR